MWPLEDLYDAVRKEFKYATLFFLSLSLSPRIFQKRGGGNLFAFTAGDSGPSRDFAQRAQTTKTRWERASANSG